MGATGPLRCDKPGPAQYCLSSAFQAGLWVASLATGHSFLGVSILVEEVEAATGLPSVHVLKFTVLLAQNFVSSETDQSGTASLSSPLSLL